VGWAVAGDYLRASAWRHAVARIAAAAAVAAVFMAAPAARAAENDVFQQAVNYAFLGRIDPPEGAEIVNRKECIVVAPDPRFKRYVRYYLARFKLDAARFNKRYSGARTLYDLDVQGDDVILEYLAADKTTVIQGYRSAQIPLPGDIVPTQKALQIISESCKAEGPRTPF
jgi:hypothetical protein